MGIASTGIAAEAPSVESLEVTHQSVELAQVTSVNELTDVLPTDWAFTALQNLVETYGCIEGFPNRTYRGQQPLTRYEFAAGLNACLDVIAAFLGDVPETDLTTIQRLQEDFAAELATLRGRVDALEADVAELRSQQFSTTTKLRGEAIGTIVVPGGDLDPAAGEGEDSSVTFQSRARLNFDASFTGDDRLRIRLQSSDNDDSLGAAGGLDDADDNDFEFELNDFYYRFPIGERIEAEIAAGGRTGDDLVTDTIIPFDGNGVADVSEPQFYEFDVGGGGAAAALNISITDQIILDLGYSADEDFSADADNGGLFGGLEQSYIGQLNFLTDGFLDAAFTFIRGNEDGDDDTFTNTYAGTVKFEFSNFFVTGFFAFSDNDNGDDDTYWMAGVGADDILVEGSQIGVYYTELPDFSDDVPFVVEGYWEIPVTSYLIITPAVVYGDLDIGGVDNDDSIYGVVRAQFRF